MEFHTIFCRISIVPFRVVRFSGMKLQQKKPAPIIWSIHNFTTSNIDSIKLAHHLQFTNLIMNGMFRGKNTSTAMHNFPF